MCNAFLCISGLLALDHELGNWAVALLIASQSTYSRQNLEDFVKCFLLGSDVLGTAGQMQISTFVFHVFSTNYAVMRCLF